MPGLRAAHDGAQGLTRLMLSRREPLRRRASCPGSSGAHAGTDNVPCMKNTVPAPFGVLVSLVLVGCASTPIARSEQVRKTADGGTILLTKGKDPHEAARAALAAIAVHCKGVYEVVEIAKTGTGQYVSDGAGYSAYGVSVASSSSSPVFGTSITYVCRVPVSPDLNQTVTGWAFLNQKCKSEGDCGGFQCERRNESGIRCLRRWWCRQRRSAAGERGRGVLHSPGLCARAQVLQDRDQELLQQVTRNRAATNW